MEILDLRVAGITVGAWVVILWVGYWLREAGREWREQRQFTKEQKRHDKLFAQIYVWEPFIYNGKDIGRYVRKDNGHPLEYDLEYPENCGRVASS